VAFPISDDWLEPLVNDVTAAAFCNDGSECRTWALGRERPFAVTQPEPIRCIAAFAFLPFMTGAAFAVYETPSA